MFARYEGMAVKSSHKMRKTYAGNLNASGVPLDCIREMLGHDNLNTTLDYIYNPLTESQTYNLMSKALQQDICTIYSCLQDFRHTKTAEPHIL